MIVETFVGIKSRILMEIAFCLVGVYHIWSFTDVERKSVGHEPVINKYQLPIHSVMDLLNCCTIGKMNKTHLIWGFIHVFYIQKKKYFAQHRALWNTQCNVWDRGTAVFNWDVLFPVTQIWLKPVMHDTSDAIMQELTHQYVMINWLERFWKILIYSALLAV